MASFTEVDSSNLKAVRFNTDDDTLDIKFNYEDRVYRYFSVPESTYQSLMNAESKGKYFHRNIKDQFYEEEITDQV